jgi:hypothetical protein
MNFTVRIHPPLSSSSVAELRRFKFFIHTYLLTHRMHSDRRAGAINNILCISKNVLDIIWIIRICCDLKLTGITTRIITTQHVLHHRWKLHNSNQTSDRKYLTSTIKIHKSCCNVKFIKVFIKKSDVYKWMLMKSGTKWKFRNCAVFHTVTLLSAFCCLTRPRKIIIDYRFLEFNLSPIKRFDRHLTSWQKK